MYLLCIKFSCLYFVHFLTRQKSFMAWKSAKWGKQSPRDMKILQIHGSESNFFESVVNRIFNWFVVTSFLSYFHLSHTRSFLHSVVYFLQDVGNRIKSMSDFFRPTAKNENEDVI